MHMFVHLFNACIICVCMHIDVCFWLYVYIYVYMYFDLWILMVLL